MSELLFWSLRVLWVIRVWGNDICVCELTRLLYPLDWIVKAVKKLGKDHHECDFNWGLINMLFMLMLN